MKQSIGALCYQVLDKSSRGRRLVRLQRSFCYACWGAGFDLQVIVPIGFVSDLTSVPRFLWPFLPPDGDYQGAAVLHDYLYSTDAPRWLCDAVFRHVMEEAGVPWWKRVLLFWGVRIGGGWARKCFSQRC